MSDKKEAKPAEGEAKDGKKKGGIGALLTKLPVLLGGVMVIEAVVLFAGFKMLGGGAKSADASQVSLEGKTADEGAAEGEAAKEGEAAPAEGGHGDAKAEEPAAGHGEAAGGHGEAAAGGDKAKVEKVDPKKLYELTVIEFRAPNKLGGRTFLYDVAIKAVVKGSTKSKVEKAFADREALIKDRVRTIIAQSDPEKLGGGSEPGLETLKRQVKFQLDEILQNYYKVNSGDGYIEEILVPRCIPFRTDF